MKRSCGDQSSVIALVLRFFNRLARSSISSAVVGAAVDPLAMSAAATWCCGAATGCHPAQRQSLALQLDGDLQIVGVARQAVLVDDTKPSRAMRRPRHSPSVRWHKIADRLPDSWVP